MTNSLHYEFPLSSFDNLFLLRFRNIKTRLRQNFLIRAQRHLLYINHIDCKLLLSAFIVSDCILIYCITKYDTKCFLWLLFDDITYYYEITSQQIMQVIMQIIHFLQSIIFLYFLIFTSKYFANYYIIVLTENSHSTPISYANTPPTPPSPPVYLPHRRPNHAVHQRSEH